eukprot:6797020-Pyramimonas_sp.AAC.1
MLERFTSDPRCASPSVRGFYQKGSTKVDLSPYPLCPGVHNVGNTAFWTFVPLVYYTTHLDTLGGSLYLCATRRPWFYVSNSELGP